MKQLKQFVAVAAILGVVACFAACDNGTTHTHQWGEWTQITALTCTTADVEIRVCELDASHTEIRIVAALGHNYQNWTQTTAPTCTEEGIETGTCTRDPMHTTTRIGVVALGHDYQNWTQPTAPTCTEAGIETGTCTRDPMHTTTRVGVAALGGHTLNEAGICTRCGFSIYYNLGDTGPGGGKIFYVSATGFTMTDNNQVCHYLEAAPTDMASTLEWASLDFTATNIAGTETAIGTGRKNTALILATDANAPAAKACEEYTNGSKTDWFLPSQDELNKLYVNRINVGNMGTNLYWSSSQYYNGTAWIQRFDDGGQRGSTKGSNLNVRAIRAF